MLKNKQAALPFIFITLLIDFTGFGIILPVMPRLIEQLTGEGISRASQYGGWLAFAYAVMQFVFAPVLGGLSDRYGRRPVLLLSLFGLGLDYLFLAFAPSIFWLFIGRLISGITGASFTTGAAYIADVSPPEKRAQSFGITGAAFGLGFIIGPVIGGLSSDWGLRAPFLIAAGLSLVNCLYGYFVLPESLSMENRRSFDWKRANPVGSFKQIQKYPVVAGLVLALTLIYIGHNAVETTWTYYTIEKFKWSERMIGYSLAAAGIGIAVVQGWLIRIIIPRLGPKNTVYIGLGLRVLAAMLIALASQGWMLFVILIPDALSFMSTPALQGIMSNQIPATEQGELQGVMGSTFSICAIIGPVLMSNIFAFFTKADAPFYFPGAAFVLEAVLTLTGILIIARYLSAWQPVKQANPETSH